MEESLNPKPGKVSQNAALMESNEILKAIENWKWSEMQNPKRQEDLHMAKDLPRIRKP